jgi:hypothetical protein
MLRQVFALSTLAMGVQAATGDPTKLCQILLANCTNHLQATITQSQCEQLFMAAVPDNGTDADVNMNTIGCRQNYAMKAASNMTSMGYNCFFAGFTGGGLCGYPLDNACAATVAICTAAGATAQGFLPYPDVATCKTNLSTIAPIWGSKQGSASSAEDSLECRVYHATAAYAGGAGQELHCGHTMYPGNAVFCGGGAPATDANHHCAATAVNCASAAQYNAHADCVASFTQFPNSNVNASDGGNNRGCRQYHGNNVIAPTPAGGGIAHCAHSGPSGGGVCGGPNSTRASWQIMAGIPACANIAAFAYVSVSVNIAFANWSSTDFMTIVPPVASGGTYTTTTAATSDNDACRVYHLTAATTDPVTHCGHGAVVSPPCGNLPVTACRMIMAGCATAFTDAATCASYVGGLLPNKSGIPGLTPSGKDDLACRLYYAGVALLSKNMGSAGMAAQTAACANAKAVSAGCGGMAAPTSGAAEMAVSMVALFAGLFAL